MQIFDICSIFHEIPKTDMILVLFIIVLDGLSVMKLVWRKNNASTNFRGGKMLNVNSVLMSFGLFIRYHLRFLFNLGHLTTQYLNLMDRFSGNKKIFGEFTILK